MEIERKFTIRQLPENLQEYPCRLIEQGYLSTEPVVRVRRDGDEYYMTYKGGGMMAREEYNLPLTADAYEHLIRKSDGIVIRKRRYVIPIPDERNLKIELDLFEGVYDGLIIAEVEFPDLESAGAFLPPEWMGEEVTYDRRYHNSWLSRHGKEDM